MKLYHVIFIYYYSLDNNIVTVAELNVIKKVTVSKLRKRLDIFITFSIAYGNFT